MRQLKKERPVCLCHHPHLPKPFTNNKPQLTEHSSNISLSHEHPYHKIGADVSRPLEFALVALVVACGWALPKAMMLYVSCCLDTASRLRHEQIIAEMVRSKKTQKTGRNMTPSVLLLSFPFWPHCPSLWKSQSC